MSGHFVGCRVIRDVSGGWRALPSDQGEQLDRQDGELDAIREQLLKSLQALREGNGVTVPKLKYHPLLLRALDTSADEGRDRLEEVIRLAEIKDQNGVKGEDCKKAALNALALGYESDKDLSERRKRITKSGPEKKAELQTSERTVQRWEDKAFEAVADLLTKQFVQRRDSKPDVFVNLSKEPSPLLPAADTEEPSKEIEQPQSKLHAFVMDAFRTSPVLSIALVAALSALVTLTGVTLAPKLKDLSFKIGDGRVELDPKPSTSGTNLALSKLEVTNTGPASKDDTQGWGPERPTFTMKKPAPYLAFNSITDHSMHGDERNFVQCRDRNGNSWGTEVTALDGHIYQCYLWFDNALAPNLDDGNPAATLQSARAKIRLPKDEPNASLVGYLSAVNANTVWSSCRFTSSQPVTISYQRGTALIHTLPGVAVDGPRLAEKYKDDVMTSGIAASDGALLGEKKLDGRIRQTAGYVLFDVKVSVKS